MTHDTLIDVLNGDKESFPKKLSQPLDEGKREVLILGPRDTVMRNKLYVLELSSGPRSP